MTFSTKNIFIIVVIATFWHAKESDDGCERVCVCMLQSIFVLWIN